MGIHTYVDDFCMFLDYIALMYACYKGHNNIVKYLCTNAIMRANPNLYGNNGKTPLHIVCVVIMKHHVRHAKVGIMKLYNTC